MAKSENSTPMTSSTLLESVYEFQLGKREIILNGPIDQSVIEKVVIPIHNYNDEDDELEDELKNYDRNDNPIILYIHSYGGYCDDGMAVVSAIKSSRTPVHTVALGKAMSMGFLILIAGHRRYCQQYCRLMYHQLSSGVVGRLRDMEEDVEQSKFLQATLEAVVEDHTLIPREVLEDAYFRKTDLYLNADQALEWGVVDSIL